MEKNNVMNGSKSCAKVMNNSLTFESDFKPLHNGNKMWIQ
jgi:hypothetical protein